MRHGVVRLRHDRQLGRPEPLDYKIAASAASAQATQNDKTRAEAQGGVRLRGEQSQERH